MPEIVEVFKFAECVNKLIQNSNTNVKSCQLLNINVLENGKYMSYAIYENGNKVFKVKNPKTGRMINIDSNIYKDGFYDISLENYKILCDKLPLNISKLETKGKFCWFTLKDIKDIEVMAVGFQFGLSGKFTFEREKHSHVEFVLSSGKFYFTDSRRFGNVTIYNNIESLMSKINGLGIDLLNSENTLSNEEILQEFRKYNNKNICVVLMNQKGIYSGIGNYLKTEILYTSNIHPLSIVSDIPDDKLISLHNNAITKITESLNSKETRLYTIYEQKIDPFGNEIVKIETPDKRHTYYVPSLFV